MFWPILVFANTEVWVYRVDLFSQKERDFTSKYTTNLESYFDFVFRGEKLISSNFRYAKIL